MDIGACAVGIAKQTNKATAATNPTYLIGVASDSALVDIPLALAEDDLCTGDVSQAIGVAYRDSVLPAADFETRIYPKAVGLLLYGIFGALSSTGTGPYVHTFTGTADTPYMTFFSRMDTELRKVAASKIDQLVFSWEKRGPVKLAVTAPGCTPSWPTSFTATTDESKDNYFRALGGTFLVDIQGTGPAAMTVTGGTITIKRNTKIDEDSSSISPTDVRVGTLDCDVAFTVRRDDVLDIREILTGSTAGTAPTTTMVTGSFDTTFALSTNSLQFQANAVPWEIETPKSNAKGGPVELTVKGKAYVPSGGTVNLTAILTNGTATY